MASIARISFTGVLSRRPGISGGYGNVEISQGRDSHIPTPPIVHFGTTYKDAEPAETNYFAVKK